MDRAGAVVGGVVSSEPSKGSSGGFLTSRYSLVPMTSDGTRTGTSPLRHYLRSYVDAIAASFEAAAGAPGGSPKRRALERFLRALDDLGAAADGLGRSDPPEQPRLPLVLVSALLAAEIEGAGCEVSVLQGRRNRPAWRRLSRSTRRWSSRAANPVPRGFRDCASC